MELQRTDQWFLDRLGKATGSRIADAIAKTKSGRGASSKNYEAQLIAERLTGKVAESFSSAAMQWGTETEPDAKCAYSFMYDVDVVEVGFVNHPTVEMSGASPDGLVGDDGMVEIKCPNTATHIDTLLSQKIAGKYITQMQWQMACTGRQWCDFVSYDPRLPARLQLFVQRVERDEKVIAQLESDIAEFLTEVSTKVEALNSLERAA